MRGPPRAIAQTIFCISAHAHPQKPSGMSQGVRAGTTNCWFSAKRSQGFHPSGFGAYLSIRSLLNCRRKTVILTWCLLGTVDIVHPPDYGHSMAEWRDSASRRTSIDQNPERILSTDYLCLLEAMDSINLSMVLFHRGFRLGSKDPGLRSQLCQYLSPLSKAAIVGINGQ